MTELIRTDVELEGKGLPDQPIRAIRGEIKDAAFTENLISVELNEIAPGKGDVVTSEAGGMNAPEPNLDMVKARGRIGTITGLYVNCENGRIATVAVAKN